MLSRKMTSYLGAAALGAAALFGGALQTASAQETRSLCVYDPIGANGFIYQSFQDYVVQAREWGIKLNTRAYTDEAVAANDFKAGKCDMVGITGIRAIHFVKFAGSLDMAGGLQSYDQVKTAIKVMSSPKAADRMSEDGYEVVGVDDLSSGREDRVPGGLELIRADLAEKASMSLLPRDCFAILHLAGQSSGELSFLDPVSDLKKNDDTFVSLNLFGCFYVIMCEIRNSFFSCL